MGNQAVVYGFIEGFQNFPTDRMYADWNRSVLGNLPEDDDYPYLVKEMFSISESNVVSLRYCFQIIHFGASYKNIDEDWETWLVKFETLLSKLYWGRAVVHLDAEMIGKYRYEWLAQKAAASFNSEGILSEPNYSWEFTGEPRSFVADSDS